MTAKQLAKKLEDAGWRLLRTRGSHHIYGKPGNQTRISVPFHAGKDLKTGLVKQALKTAGIDE